MVYSGMDFPIPYPLVNQLQSLVTMAFLNLIALAFVASAGVSAGPCRPCSYQYCDHVHCTFLQYEFMKLMQG
jgi:hypothetical protein